jgi:hypothetical protein
LNENIKSADQNRHKRDVAVYCLEMDEKNSSGWEAVLAKKNYGTRDSHVVTHHSTNLAIHCLTRAERTGSRAFSVL